jgi:hypothetical protein
MEKESILVTLLEVLSHDLLAPITAVKWQAELLEKEVKHAQKRNVYVSHIRDSVELSIALLQYVSMTIAVLQSSYVAKKTKENISDVISDTWKRIEPQYARHGVVLDASFDDVSEVCDIDVQRLQVFVWVVAKFFLSSVTAGQVIRVSGLSLAVENGGTCRYSMAVSAPHVTSVEVYKAIFNDVTQPISIEQGQQHTLVFAALIRDVAKDAGILFSAGIDTDIFTLECSLRM